MNPDEIEQLEQSLRELPLRRPSPRLDERVMSVLGMKRSPWKRPALAAALLASAALAASLLLMLLRSPSEDGPAVARPVEQPPFSAPVPSSVGIGTLPVRIEQIWSTPVAKEVVMLDDSRPVHRIQHQVVRHVRWIDERHHVRIEWNIPSEQTVLVPLEYN